MNKITLEHGEQKKVIEFTHEGRTNEKQKKYFEALFDNKLQLKDGYDEYSYFGAFRCGKSFSQQLAVYLLCLTVPGCRAIYIRNTYDELEATVIKQFLEEFEHLGAFTYLPSGTPKRCATFKNGSTLLFRSFEKDTDILSAEYDVIASCQTEDLPFDLFLQLIGRNSGRRLPGRSKGIILTEGNPASGWAKERYKDQTPEQLKAKRIFFVEGETSDNPHVTQEYIQSLIDNYPKFWLDRYLYGLWDNREELVIGEFNEHQHVIDIIDPATIHRDYIRRNGFDWGWVNPSACIWGFTDYDGVLTIYDEYYQNKTLPEDVAVSCNRHGRIWTVADHAMKGLKLPTKEDENRTVWSELERCGMNLIPCNKEELSNIVLTNTLFKTGKIRITRNCVNLLREIKNWKWKKIKLGSDKNAFEEPTDKDNHACDALNYLVANLYSQKAEDSEAKRVYNESLMKAVVTDNSKMAVIS